MKTKKALGIIFISALIFCVMVALIYINRIQDEKKKAQSAGYARIELKR